MFTGHTEGHSTVDEQALEALAEFICGDDEYTAPVYRSGSMLTRFFQAAGLPRFVHDGSTRKWWTLNALQQCTPDELRKVILRLASPREYRSDAPSTKKAINTLNHIFQLEGLRIDFKNGQPLIVPVPIDFDLGTGDEEKQLVPTASTRFPCLGSRCRRWRLAGIALA